MEATGALVHRGLAWAFILLAICGWVLMLSGVASLQQACSDQMVTTLSDLAALAGQQPATGRRLHQSPTAAVGGWPGSVGYLAPVPCDKFFSYTWWITFFHMAVLILLATGMTTLIGRFRGGMVAIVGVLLVLVMDTANTYLYFNSVNGLTGTVKSRARVLVAGSIISAIAYFCIAMVVGWHDEEAAVRTQYDTEAAGRKPPKKAAAGGGMLGGLFGKKEERRRTEEEDYVGTGAPGSPRYVSVPRPAAVAEPVAPASPTASDRADAGIGAVQAVPSAVAAAGPVTTTTYTTVSTGAVPAGPAAATPVAVTPAIPISTRPGPISGAAV